MKKHSSCKTDANNTVQVGNVKFSENYPMQFLQGTAATPAVPEVSFFLPQKEGIRKSYVKYIYSRQIKARCRKTI